MLLLFPPDYRHTYPFQPCVYIPMAFPLDYKYSNPFQSCVCKYSYDIPTSLQTFPTIFNPSLYMFPLFLLDCKHSRPFQSLCMYVCVLPTSSFFIYTCCYVFKYLAMHMSPCYCHICKVFYIPKWLSNPTFQLYITLP